MRHLLDLTTDLDRVIWFIRLQIVSAGATIRVNAGTLQKNQTIVKSCKLNGLNLNISNLVRCTSLVSDGMAFNRSP